MAGVGVTWENLWSGPGVPFGGSLIMMAVDTVLYAMAAYWLDAVIPSEYLQVLSYRIGGQVTLDIRVSESSSFVVKFQSSRGQKRATSMVPA